jgi:cyclopropane-fatty-acyl-phospholipid synthase
MDAVRLLGQYIKRGQLTLRSSDGRSETFGSGIPQVEWALHKPDTLQRIAAAPELMLGETYMDGEWDITQGSLLTLLEVLLTNLPHHLIYRRGLVLETLQKLFLRGNTLVRSQRNVAHHYDLDEWLFRRFLDPDMHYSCAYFYQPGISLHEAQRAKCQHIMHKLLLQPGQRVLDIGSGWGGLALYLAEHAGVKVTGLTLSREQLRVAKQHAKERGLQGSVEFHLQDYREHQGSYDRIVSVGMFEHVGNAHYPEYFAQVARLLRADGVALLHTIGHSGPPVRTNPWIAKYIFPGGYNPSLSEISGAIEHSPLINCDVEVLRLHYAETLAAWHKNFQAHRAEIALRLGERFCRMWEFYLSTCNASFRWLNLVVFQIQLTHRLDTLPVTRDYLYTATEQGLLGASPGRSSVS